MRSIKRLGMVMAAAVAVTSLGSAPVQADTAADSAVTVAAKHLPGYQHVGQQEDWWCGPATAYIMIQGMKYYGKISSTRSKDRDWSLSQYNLASSNYLDARNDGTYRTDMADGLNDWTGKLFKVQSNPSPTTFKNEMVNNFRYGYAIAVAALEQANGAHYNGHPTWQTVDHWIVARAYTTDIRDTHFVDPATTLWSATNSYFAYNTNDFVNRFVRPSKAIVA